MLYRGLLLAIVVAGAYLRFRGLGEPSLWLDEMLHVYRASEVLQEPWYGWILGFRYEVENGSLFYASQLLARLISGGETAVRLAPAVFGTLSIAVLAAAGRAVAGPWLGLAAAALLAVSPFHVYYSREGRVYALMMLVSCCLLWVMLRKPTKSTAALGIGVALMAAYTGAIAGPLLAAAAVCVALWLLMRIVRHRRRRSELLRDTGIRRDVLLLAAIVFGGLLVAFLYLGSERYEPEEGEPRGVTPNVTNAISRVALERVATALSSSGLDSTRFDRRVFVYLGMALFGFAALLRRDLRSGIAVAGLFGVTLVLSFGVLHYLNQWFLVRYLSPVVPVFVLALAAGVTELSRLPAARFAPRSEQMIEAVVFTGLILLLVLPNLAAARREPFQKADWRGVARLLVELARPHETVIATNNWSEVCLKHYLRDAEKAPVVRNARQNTARAQALTEGTNGAWLVTGGYLGRTDIEPWVRSFHPVLTSHLEDLGVYFHPDFQTFVNTRSGRSCGYCLETFEALGRRLDGDGRDTFFHGRGWFPVEERPNGSTFQWIDGVRAELGIPVESAADRKIRFQAMPLRYPSAPPQVVKLRLNGELAGEVTVKPGWGEYEVPVAAEHWRPGMNLLVLRLAHAARPMDVIEGSTDPRQLGLAVDFLELSDTR